jgi:putative ABC transport system permease protein
MKPRGLSSLLPAGERESLLGDLDEIEAEISGRQGSARARRWRRIEIPRLILTSLIDSLIWRTTLIKNYWKMTWRNLKKHPGYAAINVAGLAAGLACCLVILIWCRSELSFDRFHAAGDRLYRVFTKWNEVDYGTYLPAPLSEYLKQSFPEIAGASIVSPSPDVKVSTAPDKGIFARSAIVQPSFFEMFTFPFLKGDPRAAFIHPDSVVITEGLAKRLFGGEDPIGKILRLNDGPRDLAVTGVIRRMPVNSSFQFDLLVPFDLAPPIMRDWSVNSTEVFVRLMDGASPEDVERKIAGAIIAHNPAQTNTLGLQPLKDIHLHNLEGGGGIVDIYVFSAMALMILLIAAVNYMNLSTARFERRAGEIGIKKVLGSSRAQLVQQFLSESVLLTFLSLAIAVVATKAFLPAVNTFLGRTMEMPFSWSLAGAMAAITLGVGLLSGSYPAFLLSAIQPLAAFKGHRRGPSRGRRRAQTRGAALRKTLVVVQLAMSIFFMAALSVIDRQMGFIRSKSLGFDKENVVVLSLTGDLARKTQALKNALLGNPGILGASVSSRGLDEWNSSSSAEWPGKRPSDHVVLGFVRVDCDYLRTLKLEMAEGRFFSPSFPGDPSNSVVINETAAKAMGMAQPIGQRIAIRLGEKIERTVIGVVKDFHTESLHAPVEPFALYDADTGALLNIRIAPGNVPGTLETIERAVKAVVPNDPFRYRFLDDGLDRRYQSERTVNKLAVAASVLALLITCLGLFGLISYMTELRTKEIAMRKVLGASSAGIAGLFLKEIALGVALAAALAAPLSYWAAEKWLRDFTFRISFSPWMILASGFLVLLIAVLTVSVQTFRAAAANPIDAIRFE